MMLSDFFSRIKTEISIMEVPIEHALGIIGEIAGMVAKLSPDAKISASATIAANAANAVQQLVVAAQTDANAKEALTQLVGVLNNDPLPAKPRLVAPFVP